MSDRDCDRTRRSCHADGRRRAAGGRDHQAARLSHPSRRCSVSTRRARWAPSSSGEGIDVVVFGRRPGLDLGVARRLAREIRSGASASSTRISTRRSSTRRWRSCDAARPIPPHPHGTRPPLSRPRLGTASPRATACCWPAGRPDQCRLRVQRRRARGATMASRASASTSFRTASTSAEYDRVMPPAERPPRRPPVHHDASRGSIR